MFSVFLGAGGEFVKYNCRSRGVMAHYWLERDKRNCEPNYFSLISSGDKVSLAAPNTHTRRAVKIICGGFLFIAFQIVCFWVVNKQV
ncbi:hypothetical protein L596_006389 [Steinernema carpocapsae]|uniref:Uncharacterized protein n=1 Tax=Steinernema carpocapsae TaxID=34508 RepID=A0A4U8V261_STECR|nr:hypothetical protein L596_006389 [Steinernema carpocapsae]